jgi:hypothetical protein
MSQCHDLYDTDWPASPHRAAAVVTQRHDLHPVQVSKDDDQPACEAEPARELEFA